MHLDTSMKIDLIVRMDAEYRQVEFSRRQAVQMHGVKTWIVPIWSGGRANSEWPQPSLRSRNE